MPDPSHTARPLFSAWSALGLMAATGVAFGALFPLSRDRESRAFASAPDMLALSYLDLALARAPEDTALRLRVAERRLAAGQLERAREALAPLADGPPELFVLRAEIEHRAWAAAPAEQAPAALERLRATLEQTPHPALPLAAAERIAALSAQAGSSALRAAILARLARADLGDDERLRAADAACLEAGQPLEAAALRAERALGLPERDGAVHAALALRRALAAGQPEPALALFRDLRVPFGDNPRVLELGLAALAGVDDAQALEVAEELLALTPDDPTLRQRVAELRAWTRAAAAAATPAPPVAPAAPPPLRWDSREALEVDVRSAENGELVLERAALLERLGAPERALELLDGALGQSLVEERALWELKADVQLRQRDTRAALATLAQLDDRFGATRRSLQRRAGLLLALGELEPALALLASAPGERGIGDERQLGTLGWELGDIERVRAAYRAIASSAEATADDVRRLWLLEREGGDARAAASAALDGFERLGAPELLKLALYTAVEADDDALSLRALEAADRHGEQLLDDPESVRLRVSVRQGRAHRALLRAEPELARGELAHSARLLAAASADAPDPKDVYGELWKTQERQTLDVALAAGDRQLLARVYPEQAEGLSARERVFVLHQLGRDREAIGEAVSGIQSGELPEHDSGALAADADALGAEMPRQVGVLGGVLSMEDLVAARVGAALRESWGTDRTLAAQVELTRLGTQLGLSGAAQDELAAELGVSFGQSELALGLVVLDGRAPRPSLRFEQGLLELPGFDLELAARVNERSLDTAALRVLGVEDELAARAELAFLGHYSASLRASAKLYSEREARQLLGGGAALDAAVARHFGLGELGTGSLRVGGYVAPRFERAADSPVPDGASWVGLGAQLARGQLSVAPVAGRRLSLLADVTAGWLMPLQELGWSGKLGLGLSVLGGDQLSIVASASNVMSSNAGFAVYMLGADYAVSRW